jgi:hypothetical protein
MPVSKQEILRLFIGNRQAQSVIDRIPEQEGFLDQVAVDRLLLQVHWEMQRLAHEFHHGARILELLQSVIAAIRSRDPQQRLRIVDVGCGIGYAIRWLAAMVNRKPIEPRINTNRRELRAPRRRSNEVLNPIRVRSRNSRPNGFDSDHRITRDDGDHARSRRSPNLIKHILVLPIADDQHALAGTLAYNKFKARIRGINGDK